MIWTSSKSFIRLRHVTDPKRHIGLIRLRIFKMCSEFRLVPRFQKGSRSWVRWVQGLGPWWILDLARPFCRGTLETQDLKIVLCRKTLETQDLNILICSETLKTQDLKIWIVTRPWKPRTLKFWYVAKPWKPRTQNLKIVMSRDAPPRSSAG